MELIKLAIILTSAMGFTFTRLHRMIRNAEEFSAESKRILSCFNTDADSPGLHKLILFHKDNGVVEYDIGLR